MDPGWVAGGEGETPAEEKPTRVVVFGLVIIIDPIARSLAGSKALKRDRFSEAPSPRKTAEAALGSPDQRSPRRSRRSQEVCQPQEGKDVREDERLCGWRSTLKGKTPWAGPARNKAGRTRAEEGPESVRNAERARTRRLEPSGTSGCPVLAKRRRGRNRKGGSFCQWKHCRQRRRGN